MTGQTQPDSEELRALEQARCQAITAADLDTLAELLHNELRHVHVTGKVEDKTAYLAALATRPRESVREELSIRVLGDVAVTSGIQRNTAAGQLRQRVHVLQVWLREAGRWQLAEFASSGPIAEKA